MSKKNAIPNPQIKVRYAPQGETLRRFHQARDDYHHRVLIGPLGSGKTQSCIAECLHLIDNQEARNETTTDVFGAKTEMPVRRTRGVIARNTFADLQNTTIKDWRDWTDEMTIGTFVNGAGGKSPTWKATYFKTDGSKVVAEVVFLAFDLEQDMRKARGLQCSWVWVNEIKEMRFALVSLLFGRTGRYPPRSRQMMLADSNAPDRDHWLGKLALTEKPDQWFFGIQPGGVINEGGQWKPNPNAENAKNLPENYYINQVSGAVSDAYIRQNLGNEFVHFSDGRPVHPDFNEQIHVSACEAIPGYPLVVGIDFGRTPAAVVMQSTGLGQWSVLEEIVTENSSALPFGREVRRFLSERYSGYTISVWCDPAGDAMAQTRDETPIEMLRLAGLDEAMPCHTNDFEVRITALDEKLRSLSNGRPSILIDPGCTTLVRGLAGAYKYKRIQVSGGDRFTDKPDKGPESHVCEACHYGLLGAGEGVTTFEMDDLVGDVDDWHPEHSRFT